MKIIQTPIEGVAIVETEVFVDQRGAFARLFCEEALTERVGSRRIVQINNSFTSFSGTVRGMHFQYPPYAEMKLVRCTRGSVWDVAIDLRAESPTFLQWHAVVLNEANARMLIIPEGCAHGFQVLEPGSVLLYLHTAAYAPEAEDGVAYDDPKLGISWPLPVTNLSTRDLCHPPISPNFSGIKV